MLDDKDSSEVLGFLQDKGDYYTKLALIERKRLNDLEDAIAHINSETDRYRALAKSSAIDVMNLHVLTPHPAYKRADGADIGRQAMQMTTKVLTVLEVKVNKLSQRRSEIMNRNNQLKMEIDHCRRMRLQTDISHAKFEATLQDVKERIEGLLSESTAVVEEREKLVREKEALERLNVEEQAIFAEEFEGMGEFIKSQNSALEEALLRERKSEKAGGNNLLSDSSIDPGNKSVTLEEEVDMARQVGSLTNFMETEQNSLSSIQERISNYELMFEQVKKMTATTSLEEVVSNYVAHEEEMFSLYNFIQTLNADIDAVVESRNQIDLEIQLFKEEQLAQDHQRRSVLESLQYKLDSTLETTRLSEEQNKQFQDAVGQVSKKVSSLFFKLQCDQMEARGQNVSGGGKSGGLAKGGAAKPESKIALLMSQGVSEGNVLEYMGCIEQRAVDIISSYLRQQAHEHGGNSGHGLHNSHRSPTPGPVTPMHWPADPVVDLNDLSDDEGLVGGDGAAGESADADSKPIDLSTFKDKLTKKLGLSMSGGLNSSGGLGLNGSLPATPFTTHSRSHHK